MTRRTLSFTAALALAFAPAWPTSAHRPRPVEAQTLQQRVEARLLQAAPGVRFGMVVATADGTEIVAIAPDARFVPASNVKLLTTAAALETLEGMDAPDKEGGASVRIDEGGDVVLTGSGDARLSSAPDCVANCLAILADAVAARTRTVRNVVGDGTLFPDERWSPGMSWNNIGGSSGTAASALSLDDNEVPMRVTPGAVGKPPGVEVAPYFTVENRAVTVTGGATALGFERMPGATTVRLTGTIAAGAEPQRLRLGIDDPAHHAAWRFRRMLEARGVRVTGGVVARHRPLTPFDDPARRGDAPPLRAPRGEPLARLVPPPLDADLATINKSSQNLHAELLLRRVGRSRGTGSIADGRAAVAAMLARAGVSRSAYEIADGSGMSTYNRLAPRGVATFLRWAAARPWGAAWRGTLAVGGVDGTLRRRFAGTALEGRVFAKTGSLNATAALSGYMTARSGRTLAFSIFANDVPTDANATAAMDAALLMLADAN